MTVVSRELQRGGASGGPARQLSVLFAMFQGGGNIALIMPVVKAAVARGHAVRVLAGPGVWPSRMPVSAAFCERMAGCGARYGSTTTWDTATARTASSNNALIAWHVHSATSIYPKSSSKVQLLGAKDNLQRMMAQIPLTDDARAAVEEGTTAVERLIARLANVPTPAGPTPTELGVGSFVPMEELTNRLVAPG